MITLHYPPKRGEDADMMTKVTRQRALTMTAMFLTLAIAACDQAARQSATVDTGISSTLSDR